MTMNVPDITIEDVNLQMDRSGRYIEGKIEIVLTIRNNSKLETYYVRKRAGNIDYDKGNRTLAVTLCESEPPRDVKADSSPFEPERVAILPDTAFYWQGLVSVWMKRILRPPGLREIVEVVDISDVQKVVCTVAYYTPLSAREETVSASFERTVRKH